MAEAKASGLAAYEQVKAWVRARIAQGDWRPGDPVPSEAALQQQFGLSRMTVNRALRELVVEGLVVRTQGSGTVVAQLHRISSTLALRDIHDEILERGHRHSARVLKLATVPASPALAELFRLEAGAALFHSVLLHLEDGVPIQHEDRHVNPAVAPAYLQMDFAARTPTHYLLEHAPLTEASYSIEAVLPDAAQARALGIRRAAPCLRMTRRTLSGTQVASLAHLLYPGALHNFGGKFQL